MTGEDRIDACHAALVERCERDRRWVSGDGRVAAETAADLIGIAPATLRQWRYLLKGPRPYRIGGRATYRLRDLAAWLEDQCGE